MLQTRRHLLHITNITSNLFYIDYKPVPKNLHTSAYITPKVRRKYNHNSYDKQTESMHKVYAMKNKNCSLQLDWPFGGASCQCEHAHCISRQNFQVSRPVVRTKFRTSIKRCETLAMVCKIHIYFFQQKKKWKKKHEN